MNNPNSNSNILILEDDLDQMRLLVNLAQSEINKIIDDEGIGDNQRQKLRDIRIIKVSNIGSLKKAVSIYKNVLLAILDCNAPDTKDTPPHDQLVKTNHRITGQHNSVDIVIGHIPNTPITLISSWDRFHRTINRYYESKFDLSFTYIRKSNLSKVSENIESQLRTYLDSIH